MDLTTIDLTNTDPEVVFTPERRRLEYRFLQDQREEINNLDIPEEDKMFMKSKLWDDYIKFDRIFTEYHRIMREYNMWIALGALNKKMGKSKHN